MKKQFFLQKNLILILLITILSCGFLTNAQAELQPKFGTFISFDNAKYPFNFGGVGKTDSQGNTYILGRLCTSFNPAIDFKDPLSVVFFCGKNETNANLGDAFVAKFNSSGNLIYKTLLAGSKDDGAADIMIDSAGNVYVTGATRSVDFANGKPLVTKTNPKDSYAYLTKLKQDGSIDFTAYVSQGASGKDYPYSITFGKDGNIYIAGFTDSSDFLGSNPKGNPLQKTYKGGREGFIVKLDKTGNVITGTFLGGSNGGAFSDDLIDSIAFDSKGNLYVSGTTDANQFDLFQSITPIKIGNKAGAPKKIIPDGFILKMDADLSKAISFAYLGGSGFEVGTNMKISSKDNLYITGISLSADLFEGLNPAPTLQKTIAGAGDAYVVKLNENLQYQNGSYIGGAQGETGSHILIDNNENIYIAGVTLSNNFPVIGNNIQNSFRGTSDVFITKIKSDFSTIVYSSYLGGDGTNSGASISADSSGTIYIVGNTNSKTNFPITSGAFQASLLGNTDMFLVALTGIGEPFPSVAEASHPQTPALPTVEKKGVSGGGGCSILSSEITFSFALMSLLWLVPLIYLRLKPIKIRSNFHK